MIEPETPSPMVSRRNMENWIQIGNNQKTKSERNYIVQSSVSVWITSEGALQTDSDDIRMCRIIGYVSENYQNHLSLSELAEELHNRDCFNNKQE